MSLPTGIAEIINHARAHGLHPHVLISIRPQCVVWQAVQENRARISGFDCPECSDRIPECCLIDGGGMRLPCNADIVAIHRIPVERNRYGQPCVAPSMESSNLHGGKAVKTP